MIVKVQVSLADSEGRHRVLVYNEDRSIQFEMPLNAEFDQLMRQKFQDTANSYFKAFFHARLEKGEIVIEYEAPFQAW